MFNGKGKWHAWWKVMQRRFGGDPSEDGAISRLFERDVEEFGKAADTCPGTYVRCSLSSRSKSIAIHADFSKHIGIHQIHSSA